MQELMDKDLSTVKYPLNSKPNLKITIIAAIQHVLSMFVGIITPPLIVAPALGFNKIETAFFIGMALFISGIATFIQVRRFASIGTGLLSVQGTSFTFVSPILQAAKIGGPALVFGMSIVCAFVEFFLSFFLKYARKIFPPIVSGTVVMMIGLSLIKVGFVDFAGGFGAKDFGSPINLVLGSIVLISIIIFRSLKNSFLSSGCVFFGMLIGYIVSSFLGFIDFHIFNEAQWYTIPKPLKYGLSFNSQLILPFAIAYLVTTIETLGDITATSIASGEPVKGELYYKRLSGGVLADSLNSMLAGFFNTLPNTTFSQNNGLIQLTGVASRKIGYVVAIILLALGLFPKFSALIATMPRSVLGGATVVMFAFIVIGGLRIIINAGLKGRNVIILAISLSLGLGVEFVPNSLDLMPQVVRNIFASGIATSGIVGIVLNLFVPRD